MGGPDHVHGPSGAGPAPPSPFVLHPVESSGPAVSNRNSSSDCRYRRRTNDCCATDVARPITPMDTSQIDLARPPLSGNVTDEYALPPAGLGECPHLARYVAALSTSLPASARSISMLLRSSAVRPPQTPCGSGNLSDCLRQARFTGHVWQIALALATRRRRAAALSRSGP